MDEESKRAVLIEFIDLYHAYPCLWKIKSQEYYNKNAKVSAQDKLVEKLKEIDPTADKSSCVKKNQFFEI